MKKVVMQVLPVLMFALSVFAEDSWKKVEMKDFTLVGTAGEKELKKIGSKLEQFRRTLSLLMPKAELESSVPTIVYVFDSFDDYQSYFDYKKNERKIAGIFISAFDENYIAISNEQRNYNIDDVIFHEYFHYVLRRNLRRVPLWLNEGMAEYFSTFDLDESGTTAKIGIPVSKRVMELRKSGNLMPLDKLFSVKSTSPEYRESDKVGLFYAQSWALVHFLLNADNGQRRDLLFRFVDSINAGIPPQEAFQKVFQTDYKQIENELRNYVNRFAFPGYEYSFDNKISWEDTAKVSVLNLAETKLYQAKLSRFVSGGEKAEKRFLEAAALNPENSEIYRLLGAVYDFQKKPSEARKNYEKALSLDPNNYLNYYNLVKFLREDKNYDEAVKYSLQAIKLKPDAAIAYTALGSIYEYAFKDDEALKAYSEAVKLRPENGFNFYNLAKIAFRNNNNNLAAAAAKAALDTDGWINNNSVKSALIGYFAYMRDKKNEDASNMLKTALEKVDEKNFYRNVFRYLNKEIDENKLLSPAKDTNDQTISNTYIGLNLLLQGKKDEAKAKFNRVKENGNREFTEYGYAVKELEHLDSPE